MSVIGTAASLARSLALFYSGISCFVLGGEVGGLSGGMSLSLNDLIKKQKIETAVEICVVD